MTKTPKTFRRKMALALLVVSVLAASGIGWIYLFPEDTGPKTVRIFEGAVDEGTYDWTPGLTVRGLIAKAHGLKSHQAWGHILVTTSPGRLEQWQHHVAFRLWEVQEDLARRWWETGYPGKVPKVFRFVIPGDLPRKWVTLNLLDETTDRALLPGDEVRVGPPEVWANADH